MFAILNILVFVFLTGYAFILMLSKPSYVALSRTEKVLLTGREKFLLLTLMTGMISVGGFSVGVNLSALRLMIWMLMIIMAFILYKDSLKLNIIVFAYVLFLLWMLASLIWASDIGFGIRVMMKYLYPLMIMLFAFTFVKSKDFIFVSMRFLLIVTFSISLFLGGVTTHVLGIWFFYLGGVFWPMSTMVDYFAIMSGVSYLMWWRTNEKKYLYLIGWLLLSSILGSVRTGLLGIFIVFATASFLRYRLYSLPYIGGIIMMAVLSVIFIPQIKEKMFYEPDQITSISELGTINSTQIDSSGRFAMWEWSLKEFYEDKKLIGSGIGAIQERFYSGNHPFGRIKIIHNDYVQILSDTGLIGLFLYFLFVVLSILTAIKFTNKMVPSYLHSTSFLVVTSFAGALTTMMTDNVVNYAFAVHSFPFIFAGMLMAYINIHRGDLYTLRESKTK